MWNSEQYMFDSTFYFITVRVSLPKPFGSANLSHVLQFILRYRLCIYFHLVYSFKTFDFLWQVFSLF